MKVDLPVLYTEFQELEAGDVFLYKDDFFIKIDAPNEHRDNAIDLEDGTFKTLKADRVIHHFPGATVHVEEPDDDDDDDDD